MDATVAIVLVVAVVQICVVISMWLAVKRAEEAASDCVQVLEDMADDFDDPCYDTIEEPFDDDGEDEE